MSAQQIFVETHREWMNDTVLLTDNSHFISQIYSWKEKVRFFNFAALTLDNFLIFKMHFSKIWGKRYLEIWKIFSFNFSLKYLFSCTLWIYTSKYFCYDPNKKCLCHYNNNSGILGSCVKNKYKLGQRVTSLDQIVKTSFTILANLNYKLFKRNGAF